MAKFREHLLKQHVAKTAPQNGEEFINSLEAPDGEAEQDYKWHSE